MTEAERKIAVWSDRRHKILARGKCAETQGVVRKLSRKIAKARAGVILA